MFGWLPGADLNSVVQREIKDLNDTRTGSADRTGAWNWQDSIGAWMAGSNKEEVLRLATEKANKDLAKKLSPSATAAQANLGHLSPLYQGVAGKTREQLESEILQDTQRGKALQTTLATNPRLDGSTISRTASVGEIMGAGSKATVAHADAKETEATEKEERRYRDSQDLIALQFANSAADRQADREYRRDQTAYQNRKLDMQEARLDRKDRQAAIQQMMAGLAQLGASIAI
jgi:hypothetical protein